MGLSIKQLALIHSVDQYIDLYELNEKPEPEVLHITDESYEALCKYKGQEALETYRKIKIDIVKASSKT